MARYSRGRHSTFAPPALAHRVTPWTTQYLQTDEPRDHDGRVQLTEEGLRSRQGASDRADGQDISIAKRRDRYETEVAKHARSAWDSVIDFGHVKSGMVEHPQNIERVRPCQPREQVNADSTLNTMVCDIARAKYLNRDDHCERQNERQSHQIVHDRKRSLMLEMRGPVEPDTRRSE